MWARARACRRARTHTRCVLLWCRRRRTHPCAAHPMRRRAPQVGHCLVAFVVPRGARNCVCARASRCVRVCAHVCVGGRQPILGRSSGGACRPIPHRQLGVVRAHQHGVVGRRVQAAAVRRLSRPPAGVVSLARCGVPPRSRAPLRVAVQRAATHRLIDDASRDRCGLVMLTQLLHAGQRVPLSRNANPCSNVCRSTVLGPPLRGSV